MRLIELQRGFRDWLRTEDDTARVLLGDGPGLAVYLNNHRSSLMDSLSANYERTASWLGEDAFAAVSAAYIERNAPCHWTLDAYGDHFAEFLSELYPGDPAICDLAAIEWAMAEVFIAADAPTLTAAMIPAVDWDKAIVMRAPATRIVQLSSNADQLFDALIHDDPVTFVSQSNCEIMVLIWRKSNRLHRRRTSPDEAHWLMAMSEGVSFAEVSESLVHQHGEHDGIQRAGTWLAQWTTEGLLIVLEATDGVLKYR